MDLALSFFALPFLAILMLVIAPIICFSDHGPVFYIAPRLGKNGKTFFMYKFRTMIVDAPDIRNQDSSAYSSVDDPRLTKFGRFLRKSSLDEVPQIINVVKGDMSVVGPRPDLPDHIDRYTPDEARKLEIRPGITGYSQAYYRKSIDLKQRMQNDVYYVDHLTFGFDVKIILKTVVSVLGSKGVYAQSNALISPQQEKEQAS